MSKFLAISLIVASIVLTAGMVFVADKIPFEQILGAKFISPDIVTVENIPQIPSPNDCTKFNIGFEYDKYFSVVFMEQMKKNCETVKGKYTKNSNEVSCYAAASMDCNGKYMQYSKILCEYMNANPYCRNDLGYFGCICKGSVPTEKPKVIQCTDNDPAQDVHIFGTCTSVNGVPSADRCSWIDTVEQYKCDNNGLCISQFDKCPVNEICNKGVCKKDMDGDGVPDDEQGGEIEYTCGIDSDITCSGTCPATHPTCEELYFVEDLAEACACVNLETEEVHPDWKLDGKYHNPKEELPPEPVSYNCYDDDGGLPLVDAMKKYTYCEDDFGKHYDYCTGGMLADWYCANIDGSYKCIDSTTRNCVSYVGEGSVCSNGACTVPPNNPPVFNGKNMGVCPVKCFVGETCNIGIGSSFTDSDGSIVYVDYACTAGNCGFSSHGTTTSMTLTYCNWQPSPQYLDLYATVKDDDGAWDTNHENWASNPTIGNLICTFQCK